MRAFFVGGLLLASSFLFPIFGGCGISVTVDLGPEGGAGTGGSVALDAQGCWQTGKYCLVNGVNSCVLTSDVTVGCGSGACDPCLIPHATAKCGEDGKCEIGECHPGYKDCDVSSFDHHTTGCEENILNDQTHCGECAINCYDDTASDDWVCDNGKCRSINCTDPNTTECNFDDGITCETNKTTTENCGFCNNKCEAPGAVNTCIPNSSPQGFGCHFECDPVHKDCDGLEPNGCEKNLSNDKENCGDCGKNCDNLLGTAHGTTQCLNGACEITCDPGYGNCNGGTDGCERSLTTLTDCGACGLPCNPQHATGASCATLSCTFGGCTSGYGDCNNNDGDGCEQQTNTSAHCTACNSPCTAPANGTATCASGSCVKDCTGPLFDDCDSNPNNCEQLNTLQHCGQCNQACTAPANGTADCGGGSCVKSCNPPSYKDCDGNTSTCEPLGTNQNCADCGNSCSSPKTCQGGSCKCPPPQSDCGGTCVNVLGNDKNNCGNCGIVCAGTATCSSGTCVCAAGNYCAGVGCCTGGKTCQAGPACACPAGSIDCGGTCYAGGTCCSDGACNNPTPQCCDGAGQDHKCHSWSYNC